MKPRRSNSIVIFWLIELLAEYPHFSGHRDIKSNNFFVFTITLKFSETKQCETKTAVKQNLIPIMIATR